MRKLNKNCKGCKLCKLCKVYNPKKLKTMITIIIRSKKLANGEQPICLRITKDRESKIFSLGISCLKEEWNGYELSRKHPNYSVKNRIISKKKDEALKIIDEFKLDQIDFTLSQFEEKFRGVKNISTTVTQYWKEKIDDLNRSGRTGNARAYKDVYNSFFKFCSNNKLFFREITPAFLDKYEVYLRGNNNTDGGIGVKMRTIRALYNDAIRNGIAFKRHYPFDVYKVSKLKGTSIKKALTRDEVRLIETLDVNKHPHLIDAKNYFIFSYYTGGMNFVDMLKLKWDNIQSERILYLRSKTKGKFSVRILKPVQIVLDYYKTQNRLTPYVFPILLKEGLTPIQIENRKLKTLKRFNKQLKEIAEIQGVNQKVSSYTIRHSFATNLKYSGISADIIGQLMGHQDVSITNAYLKEFGDNLMDDAMNNLLKEPPM